MLGTPCGIWFLWRVCITYRSLFDLSRHVQFIFLCFNDANTYKALYFIDSDGRVDYIIFFIVSITFYALLPFFKVLWISILVTEVKKDGKNDFKCEMCTYAMGYLQGLIEKKETKEEIENAVKTMCRVLPGHYREQVC